MNIAYAPRGIYYTTNCRVLLSGKYLQIMHATNAACCMTPKIVATDAAGCTPHTQNLFLGDKQKFLQAYIVSTGFEFSWAPSIFMKSTSDE